MPKNAQKDCEEESLSPSELPQNETQPLVKEEKETVDIVKKEGEDNVSHLAEYLSSYFQEQPHQCELCDKAFTTEQDLGTHLLSHTGGTFVCDTGGTVIAQNHSLTFPERFHSREKPFPCGSCGKSFRTSSSRNRHQRYWHQSTGDSHVCPYCNFKGASSSLLLSHIRELHTKDKESPSPSHVQKQIETQPLIEEGEETAKKEKEDKHGHVAEHLLTHFQERSHQCHLCDQAFTSKKNLRMHLLSHSGGPYVCDTCGKAFAQKHSLTVHERFHSGEKPFPCSSCEKCFRTSSSRNRHQIYFHHSTEDCDVCPYCDFKAVSSRFLLSHIRILHSKGKESPSPSEVQKPIETQHSAKEGKEIVEKEKEDINDHLWTPSKERRHRCKLCAKAFTSRQNLRTHVRSHTGERPYVCDTCGKGFTSKNYLTVHERFHSGERRYPCGSCSKRFFSTGDLFRHEATHAKEFSKIQVPNDSGELILKCEVCSKAHVRMEHTHTGPFICATCERGVCQKSREHERAHSREEPHVNDNNGRPTELLLTHSGKQLYQCKLCDKAFAQKGHLKIHFRNHTGERPYICDTCGKGFTRRHYLTVHERFHSGEKPYSCSACSKCYATSGDLLRHKKKVHTRAIKSGTPS